MFRKFENAYEEQLASDIIAKIDQGERWIFQGADNSSDFGGFMDRLFFRHEDTYGTFCASIYCGKLRFQIGFNTDMPDEISDELLTLMTKARTQLGTLTSVWYPPDNEKLHQFIFTNLPWKAKGHKTHELTFKKNNEYKELKLPKNIRIIPFEKRYLEASCNLLDASLSHTLDDPKSRVFFNHKEAYLSDWIEKAEMNDCCVMLENGDLAGIYILKGSEIDLMAIHVSRQGNGLGSLLLHHAREHIFAVENNEPHLYCIDRNPHALRFYLREGMEITGHSGYAFFEALTE
ncbi:MAG TPA: hypothetical protein DIC19_02950 [Erysipelotrichaceae bacterium]|nr:hypothetical protein [Erysipelotrichaceae bacterium]